MIFGTRKFHFSHRRKNHPKRVNGMSYGCVHRTNIKVEAVPHTKYITFELSVLRAIVGIVKNGRERIVCGSEGEI